MKFKNSPPSVLYSTLRCKFAYGGAVYRSPYGLKFSRLLSPASLVDFALAGKNLVLSPKHARLATITTCVTRLAPPAPSERPIPE